jgi:DNA-binding MarR family transcriptional regulator/N-acetylglutamate synthase-like GNAT family acetyltransferase
MTIMADPIPALRRFNRFYTERIGILDKHHLASDFSLTEVRVLYELSHRAQCSASDLVRDLALDAGYVSRMLRALERRGLLSRAASRDDARRSELSLTPRGRTTFAKLDRRASDHVAELIEKVAPPDRERLVAAMRTIESILDRKPRAEPYILRPPRAGDLGWVVHRHGALYAEEFGWDDTFEALVAKVVAEFVEQHDPRDRCFIAERDGAVVGSVFLAKKSEKVGKLRLLYVEPSARGLGIGVRLVDECIAAARSAGYRKLTLWTQSNLRAARTIYERAGFRRVAREPHRSFGHDLVAETWDLDLPR